MPELLFVLAVAVLLFGARGHMDSIGIQAAGFGALRMPELLVILAVAVLLFGARGKFGSPTTPGLSHFRNRVEEHRFRRGSRLQATGFQPDPMLLAIFVLSGVLVILLVTLFWLRTN